MTSSQFSSQPSGFGNGLTIIGLGMQLSGRDVPVAAAHERDKNPGAPSIVKFIEDERETT